MFNVYYKRSRVQVLEYSSTSRAVLVLTALF